MAGFAVDLPARMLGDGVIADEADTALRPEMLEDEVCQQTRQGQAGPLSQGQDAMIAGRVAFRQAGDAAQQVGDGAPAGGEDGGRAPGIGGLQGVPALHPLTAIRAPADVDVELADDRPARDLGLVLVDDGGFDEATAAAGASRG